MENTQRTLREQVIELGYAKQDLFSNKETTQTQFKLAYETFKKSIYYYDLVLLQDMAKNGNTKAINIVKSKSFNKKQKDLILNVSHMLDGFSENLIEYNETIQNSGYDRDKIESLLFDDISYPIPMIEYDKNKDLDHTFKPKTINTIKSTNKAFKTIKEESLKDYTVTEHVEGIRCLLLDDMVLDYSMQPIKNEHLHRTLSLIGLYFASKGIILDGKIYKENTPLSTIKEYCNTKDVTTNEHRANLIKERDTNKKAFLYKYNDSSLDELTTHEQGYKFYITDCYVYNEPTLSYDERMTRLKNQDFNNLMNYFIVLPSNKKHDNVNDYIKDQLRRKRKISFNKNKATYHGTTDMYTFVLV